MRRVRQASLLLAVAVILMGVCGCMNAKKTYSSREIVEIYNRKYEDCFTFVTSGGQLWTENYCEIILASEKLSGAQVCVWIFQDGTMLDNYMPLKYKSEVEARVFSLAQEIYINCMVANVPIHYGVSHFSPELTLEEYLGSKKSMISVAIATTASPDAGENDAKKFVEALKEHRIAADVRILYYDHTTWGDVQKSEVASKIFTPVASKRLWIRVNEDYTINKMEWSK